MDVAKQEIRRGRLHLASAPLERAAEIFRMHGDLPSASEAWFRLGRVYAWRHAHGEAARFLGAALRAAEAGGQGTQLPRIHLALAAACRGCGDLHGERHHAELAAALAATALGRIQAAAVLARADLCSGKPGAERMLARCEADLRQAGFPEEADRARAALVDARLRAGDAIQAAQILPPGPERAVERLAAARLDLAAGEVAEACAALELLGSDACLPVALRAMCYAQLADALRWEGRLQEARGAAVAAAALLLVERRDRSEDIQLHAVLARVFRGVGDPARAVGHRSQARQRMRALLRTARTPREGRRLLRALHVREVTVDRRAG